MRWYTCTPVAFGGGPDFFARDSGLLCRGFQALGCESCAVMPGERKAEDGADLIRTEYANLESADWWKSHHLDGVVLYAWGSPKFRRVAAAIREAGVFLILNQDNSGLVSPLAGFGGWREEQFILTGRGTSVGRWLSFVRRVARGLSLGLLVTDPLRAVHLKQGNVIACVSPVAADRYRKLCTVYGGEELARRVEVMPHPVEQAFHFNQSRQQKSRQIVCVGRWQDDLQKRPALMQAVLQQLTAIDAEVVTVVIGNLTRELREWHDALPADQQRRIQLRGMVDRNQLAEVLVSSRIFYSPSAFESFGIAAGEALCSGCSVVAGQSVSMAAFDWFVSENSGRLAAKDDGATHLLALTQELLCWDQGGRVPQTIADFWSARLHADRVAALALEMAGR